MPHRNPLGATLVVAMLALGGCSTPTTHDAGGIAFDNQFMPPTAAGSTMTGTGGSVSGGTGEPAEKAQRGNTPVGMDRDGHGPAAGAIIDPTGAATSRKPY